MKTPMQELLIYILEDCNKDGVIQFSAHETFEKFLNKEKKVMCDFATAYTAQDQYEISAKDYYNENFNTKDCQFYPKIDTTSATICANCGKEKFEHNL